MDILVVYLTFVILAERPVSAAPSDITREGYSQA
jgi:hypothetical protein